MMHVIVFMKAKDIVYYETAPFDAAHTPSGGSQNGEVIFYKSKPDSSEREDGYRSYSSNNRLRLCHVVEGEFNYFQLSNSSIQR